MHPLPCISDAEARQCFQLVRHSIENKWHTEMRPTPRLKHADWIGNGFVSLHQNGDLRGCIGCTDDPKPLAELLVKLAKQCAFSDPRFAPLTREELDHCTIEISLLGPRKRIDASNHQKLLTELVPGQGLLLQQRPGDQALFLPQVWEQLISREAFLDALFHKAQWPMSPWSDNLRAWQFDCLILRERR